LRLGGARREEAGGPGEPLERAGGVVAEQLPGPVDVHLGQRAGVGGAGEQVLDDADRVDEAEVLVHEAHAELAELPRVERQVHALTVHLELAGVGRGALTLKSLSGSGASRIGTLPAESTTWMRRSRPTMGSGLALVAVAKIGPRYAGWVQQ